MCCKWCTISVYGVDRDDISSICFLTVLYRGDRVVRDDTSVVGLVAFYYFII